MSRSIFAAISALSLLSIFPPTALATHVEPAKAKKAQFELVNSFIECTSPNTTTSTGQVACTPVQSEGIGCGFLANGSGKLSIKATGSGSQGTQDFKLSAVASGLNSQCLQLCIKLSFRATTDDCPEGSCTIVDVDNQPTSACCTVTGGKCKVNTTLSAALPNFFTPGKNTGIEIHGCGLKDSAGFAFPSEITCGVLLK